MINVIPIIPILWGMGFLVLGFVAYSLVGLWGLLVVIAGGLIGIFLVIKMMKSANKKDKTNDRPAN